jgi:hypothetical protein
VFNPAFSNISAISWRPVLVVKETRRNPPSMGKQLVNFITCGCESSALFFVIYKAGRETTPFKASFTTKTGRHDIAEILLKAGLNTNNQSIKSINHEVLRILFTYPRL